MLHKTKGQRPPNQPSGQLGQAAQAWRPQASPARGRERPNKVCGSRRHQAGRRQTGPTMRGTRAARRRTARPRRIGNQAGLGGARRGRPRHDVKQAEAVDAQGAWPNRPETAGLGGGAQHEGAGRPEAQAGMRLAAHLR